MPQERLPELHELEREVMSEVWSRGESTVREVLDGLNARAEKTRAYTTVMTVMSRLAEKDLLVRRRSGKTDHYTAALSRADYHERRAAGEVADLIDEYGDKVLVHFARSIQQLDPERRRELRRLAGKKPKS
ncbi:BlaI/MecI/CopY family transcriptional regulator [Paraconexibacter algicola]|uniref:BlaI/MecI/CopY family transcriptional regulator n=1 Tax=Paraconexibacter algicola TaxID=2133960 RepID=A0A2T4UM76_9ACTN|nr:BlaI/MecI/CopY family transcriptional regulator [Paraconexibacter algicola]PTL60318.1 hypothetical protein C7Y72_12050 [Paraconexibacter algicola]